MQIPSRYFSSSMSVIYILEWWKKYTLLLRYREDRHRQTFTTCDRKSTCDRTNRHQTSHPRVTMCLNRLLTMCSSYTDIDLSNSRIIYLFLASYPVQSTAGGRSTCSTVSWIHPYRIAAHAFANFFPYDFYRKYNTESIKSKRYSIALSFTHFSCHVSRYRRLHHCGDIRLYVPSAQQTRISLFNLALQTFSTSIHKNKSRK